MDGVNIYSSVITDANIHRMTGPLHAFITANRLFSVTLLLTYRYVASQKLNTLGHSAYSVHKPYQNQAWPIANWIPRRKKHQENHNQDTNTFLEHLFENVDSKMGAIFLGLNQLRHHKMVLGGRNGQDKSPSYMLPTTI